MRNLIIIAVVALATMYLLTSGGSGTDFDSENGSTRGTAEVGPAETFTWHGQQPISFEPPIGWQSGRYQQAGRDGVTYTNSGQHLAVTEYTKVGSLDGCANLQDSLSKFGSADTRTLQKALKNAVRSPHSVDDTKQAKMLASLRNHVEKAQEAVGRNDLSRARQEIDYALRTRFKYRFTLDDYLDEVMFDRKTGGDLKRVAISLPDELSVGGEPAVSVDYEVDIDAQYATRRVKKTEFGREVYVLNNNRLFIASFQGKRENLALFENVVNSITFPDGPCSL
jgi:hypothetical protein